MKESLEPEHYDNFSQTPKINRREFIEGALKTALGLWLGGLLLGGCGDPSSRKTSGKEQTGRGRILEQEKEGSEGEVQEVFSLEEEKDRYLREELGLKYLEYEGRNIKYYRRGSLHNVELSFSGEGGDNDALTIVFSQKGAKGRKFEESFFEGIFMGYLWQIARWTKSSDYNIHQLEIKIYRNKKQVYPKEGFWIRAQERYWPGERYIIDFVNASLGMEGGFRKAYRKYRDTHYKDPFSEMEEAMEGQER